MTKPSFEERRPMTLQLLRDRGAKFNGSSFLINFEEKGPHTGEHWVFNAEMVKQAFGEPKDPDNPDSEYVENLRAVTSVLLEKRMLELKRVVGYSIWKALQEVFPLDGSADSDYEHYWSQLRERERNRGRNDDIVSRYKQYVGHNMNHTVASSMIADERLSDECDVFTTVGEVKQAVDQWRVTENSYRYLKILLTRVEIGIDALTRLMLEDDLVVEFTRARTVREERLKEARDQRIVGEYEGLRSSGKQEKAAAFEVATDNGISTSTVRLLVEQARLARGEEKRKRGRPKKKGA